MKNSDQFPETSETPLETPLVFTPKVLLFTIHLNYTFVIFHWVSGCLTLPVNKNI